MIEEGSTMTMEAWAYRYKNNLDWNHAWGAAPANIIPRYVVGVRPTKQGFEEVLIQPQPASLEQFEAKVPTPLGSVHVNYRKTPAQLEIELPGNMKGRIDVSNLGLASLKLNQKEIHLDASGFHDFNLKASN